jgi:hypothetical protein
MGNKGEYIEILTDLSPGEVMEEAMHAGLLR